MMSIIANRAQFHSLTLIEKKLGRVAPPPTLERISVVAIPKHRLIRLRLAVLSIPM
jgi:hypothetical protein